MILYINYPSMSLHTTPSVPAPVEKKIVSVSIEIPLKQMLETLRHQYGVSTTHVVGEALYMWKRKHGHRYSL